MTRLVTVYKQKFNGYESRRFQAELVDWPEPGWIATLSDASIHPSFKANRPAYTTPYVVYFLSTARMLTTSFYFTETGELQEAQCDVAMPATIDGDSVRFVDLELDLIIRGDGSHYLRDFHEFAEHRVRMGYSDEMVSGARAALLEALRLFRNSTFPFDGAARKLLERELAIRGKALS